MTGQSAWKLRELVVSRELSSEAVVRAVLEDIEAIEPKLRAFISLAHDSAILAAQQLDQRLAEGQTPGALCGVPISVKDLFWTNDLPTTGGSVLFRDNRTAVDAVAVARARAAGAIVIGKTNTPEFGVFPRTVNRLVGETVNPWDTERTCGGSSGGAAASVAAELTPIAIGGDSAGSIRIPSALCGVMGLYPSRGLVPLHGSIVRAPLFTSIGPIARDARDLATLLRVMAGPLEGEIWSWSGDQGFTANVGKSIANLRVLFVEENGLVSPESKVMGVVSSAVSRLDDLGAQVSGPSGSLHGDRWVESFYAIARADRYASLGQRVYEDPQLRDQLCDYAKRHFEQGRRVTGAEYSLALDTMREVTAFMYGLIGNFDVLVTPTVGGVAPLLSDPLTEDDRLRLVAYTFVVNHSGMAAVTVPCGLADGLPVGLQVIARPGAEALLLRVASALMATTQPLMPPLRAVSEEGTEVQ